METKGTHQPASSTSLPSMATTYTHEVATDVIVNSLSQVARLVHNGVFADISKAVPWQGNHVEDALDWFKWSRQFADQACSSGPVMKNSLAEKLKTTESSISPAFPVPFDLRFLQTGIDHFIEALVMNTSANDAVITQLLDAVESDYAYLVTTPFHRKEVVLHYRNKEKEVFRHIKAWQELCKMRNMDLPKNKHCMENCVLTLVEKFVLWLESSHSSVWFQFRLGYILINLCEQKRGWDIILSCLVTDLGRFEQPRRPVVRRLLDLMVTWIYTKCSIDGLDCQAWSVDFWRVARAAEFNAAFLKFYLTTLDEMVKSLGNMDASARASFVQREDFRKVLMRFYNLLCMEDCVKCLVLNFLHSRCDLSTNAEDNVFVWVTINQELSAKFISD